MKLTRFTFVLFSLAILTSCGDGTGFTSVGGGGPIRDCFDWEGTYAGPATWSNGRSEDRMGISITQDDNCNLKGSAVLQPCVPVTPINGLGGFGGFRVETLDGALQVELAWDTTFGARTNTGFTYTNVKNIPNCPASGAGRAHLQIVE